MLIFLMCLHVGYNFVIEFNSFKPLKDYFDAVLKLVLRNTMTLAFLISWISPLLFTGSMLPQNPDAHNATISFMEGMLSVMIPVIFLSLTLPCYQIHIGMARSRSRTLSHMEFKLERIKKKLEKKPQSNLWRYRLLCEEFRNSRKNNVWPATFSIGLKTTVTPVLPVLSFLVSSGTLRL